MPPFSRCCATAARVIVGAAMTVSVVCAADYPAQAIRVIVPFTPGGSTDIVARIVMQRMSRELGQAMVVENRGGAGGAIGATLAARAEPDGYTLSIATVSTMAVNPACRPNDLPYDPLRDFAPVTNFANVPSVITVHPKFPAQDFQGFVQELRSKPGRYTHGSSGTCSALHLFGEAFKMSTRTDAVHVPYKGAGPAIAGVIAGQIDIMFNNLPSSMSQIQAGALRAVAIAWPQRLAALPDVPTLAEVGYPELNQPAWYGLLVPKDTAPHIIQTLRDAAVVALHDPAVIAALEHQGAVPSGNTPEAFSQEIQMQYDWARNVVANRDIQLQ